MFPEIKRRVPLPPPPSKIRYLMFPVPHYYFCSSVSIKSWPYFPRSCDINAIFPVPKTPRRASSIINFRFSLNKIRRLQLLFSWSQYCLLQRNTNAVDLMYCMTTQVAQNRKLLVGPLSFREGKQCLSNSPEISRITFILLLYPPQTLFVGVYYFHVVRPSVRNALFP